MPFYARYRSEHISSVNEWWLPRSAVVIGVGLLEDAKEFATAGEALAAAKEHMTKWSTIADIYVVRLSKSFKRSELSHKKTPPVPPKLKPPAKCARCGRNRMATVTRGGRTYRECNACGTPEGAA